MKGKRWTEEEDMYLRDEVLRSISEGGSQLEAFERVGNKLGRTAGACGFRWNAVLRQQNPIAYKEAKKKRVYHQLQKKRRPQIFSFQTMYQSLEKIEKDWKEDYFKVQNLRKQLEEKEVRLAKLKEENQELRQSHGGSKHHQELLKRYQELLELVQKLQQP